MSRTFKTTTTGQRWTCDRKAAVVRAIYHGEISRADAMREHALSAEEMDSWSRRYAVHGPAGLAQMKLQELRA